MAGYAGKQGRYPKPSTLRESQKDGNLDDSMPTCPTWLSSGAKRIWHKEAPGLHKNGLLTVKDGPIYANYCLLRDQLQTAYAELGDSSLTVECVNKNGNSYETARPQISIIHKCIEQINSLSAKFGMTPADYSRIPKNQAGESRHQVNQTRTVPVADDPREFLKEFSK